jgi:hypothetical protein
MTLDLPLGSYKAQLVIRLVIWAGEEEEMIAWRRRLQQGIGLT